MNEKFRLQLAFIDAIAQNAVNENNDFSLQLYTCLMKIFEIYCDNISEEVWNKFMDLNAEDKISTIKEIISYESYKVLILAINYYNAKRR